MANSYAEEVEEQLKFKSKGQGISLLHMFGTLGSQGKNPEKLAQILSVFDFNMKLLGWEDKPLAKLSNFLTQYQASIDGSYHKDYKDVLISEEIERKRSERKGFSVFQQ